MGLMKTPVDLSKDIDEHCPAVLIISLREEMKEWAAGFCQMPIQMKRCKKRNFFF